MVGGSSFSFLTENCPECGGLSHAPGAHFGAIYEQNQVRRTLERHALDHTGSVASCPNSDCRDAHLRAKGMDQALDKVLRSTPSSPADFFALLDQYVGQVDERARLETVTVRYQMSTWTMVTNARQAIKTASERISLLRTKIDAYVTRLAEAAEEDPEDEIAAAAYRLETRADAPILKALGELLVEVVDSQDDLPASTFQTALRVARAVNERWSDDDVG